VNDEKVSERYLFSEFTLTGNARTFSVFFGGVYIRFLLSYMAI